MTASSEQRGKRSKIILGVVGVLWILAVGAGLRIMLNYESAPSISGRPPAAWPAGTKVLRTSGLATILVVAHPHCPCTRATIGELAVLMAQLHNRATATIVFSRPKGFPREWEETDLWRDAANIPGVTVVDDEGGIETDRFGAQASGQTMLYDADGELKFTGGITASRGHSGDNAGRSAIVSLVTAGKSEVVETSVYGCSLHDGKANSDDGGMPWNTILATNR